MAHLTLALLGPFQATVDGRAVTGFPTEKARALLAYLAVEAGRPHPRATLAALLWPEMPNEAAMSNLRKTLHRLRQALDAPAPGLADRVVRITRQTVQFDVTMCAVDVTSVRALLEASAAHPHRQLARCVPCLERLAQAVALYRGELLSGLALADAPEFEEWLLLEREATLQQALRALSALADAETLRGAYEQARAYAARQLALDPCREEAHRQAMRALALAGQRSAALAQYAACRRLLDETLGVEPETETVALYRRIQQGRAPDGADAEPGQPPLGAVPLVHLPPQVTPFIGRARELRQIQERLLDPACRLLTVLGGGGMGKTRLSIQAAHQLAATSDVVDDITFISLAEVSDAGALPGALAAGLGLPPDATRAPWQRVLDYLRPGAHLLILDNVEHLLSAAPRLAELLVAAPGTRLLVTSRTPLALQAEWRLPLEGLELERPEQTGGATDEAVVADAVRLFVQAARRVRPDFALTPAVAADVGRICRLVQGMPLALEIAATWTRALDCGAIADEIVRDMAFLVSSLRDTPARHHSVEAVFAQSWRLLAPDDQERLARLSVFHGASSLEAAGAVAGVSALDLATLLDASLLRHAEGGWYELHDLVRQFAARQLAALAGASSAENPAATTQQRHSDYYLGLVAVQEPRLYGAEPRAAVAAVQRHWGNVHAAWQWAAEHGRLETLTASLDALACCYEVTARFAEAESLLGQALVQVQAALDTTQQPGAPLAALSVRLRVWQGQFQERQSRLDAALASGEAALSQAAAWDDPEGQALARHLLGAVLPHRGEFEQAARHLRLAVAHFAASGRQRWLAAALLDLGIVQWRRGAYDQAVEEFQQARVAFGAVGESAGLARVASALGGVRFEQGQFDQALALAHEAARLYDAVDDRRNMAATAGNLALVYGRLGQYERALAHNQQDLETCRALGDRHGTATALENRATLYVDADDMEDAMACAEEALRIEEALGNAWERARHLASIGALALRQGADARALALFEEALPVLRVHGAPYYLLPALQDQAEALYRVGCWTMAAAACAEALVLAEELSQRDSVLRCRVLGALVAFARGETVAAPGALEALLREADEPADQAMLHYELWRMGQGEQHAQSAVALYQELCERAPRAAYRIRVEELRAAVGDRPGLPV